jgi:hypothetical protein
VQPAHDRAHRDGELRGGLGVGLAVQVDIGQHGPLVLGQRGHRGGEVRGQGGSEHDLLGAGGARSGPGVEESGGVGDDVARATAAIVAGVAQDGQQPGARVAAVEGVQPAVGAQQGLLEQVLGVAGLRGQGGCHAPKDVVVGQHVLAEALVTAADHRRALQPVVMVPRLGEPAGRRR